MDRYEGPVGTAGIGACAIGTLVCQAGRPECDGWVGPSAEVCNGLDDDCDGEPDEAGCGHPDAVDAIGHASWLGVPVVVLGELRTGFALGTRARQNEAELQSFLASSVVRVLDVDDEASRIYAEIVVVLRRTGTPLPTNDIWIAAVAAREGVPVLTFDEHFDEIGRVGVQLLTK